MKRNYKFIVILTALVLAVASFSACSGNDNNNKNDSAAPNSSYNNSTEQDSSIDESEITEESITSENQSSDESSETEESSEESLQETSEDESSIDEEQNSKNANDAQNPSESSSSTGNKDFDNVFKDNKLDIALDNEMKLAETTETMVNTMMKYEDLWITEIENANSKLQSSSLSDDEKKSIQDEYDEWFNNLESEKQKIIDKEKEKWGDGSIYKINAAKGIKDYCREFAMKLYEKLYQLDGSFELAYNE